MNFGDRCLELRFFRCLGVQLAPWLRSLPRRIFADQAYPFAPIKFEHAGFEDGSSGSPANVGFRKEQAGQEEVKLYCSLLAEFITSTGELL